MTYARRKLLAHNRIRETFGTDEAGLQLYVWHSGAQVTAYQSGGTRGRNILAQILVKDDTLTITATKAEFTTVPVPGDEVKLGTVLATARTLRVDSVRTKHGQPWFELELLDPNTATTAP